MPPGHAASACFHPCPGTGAVGILESRGNADIGLHALHSRSAEIVGERPFPNKDAVAVISNRLALYGAPKSVTVGTRPATVVGYIGGWCFAVAMVWHRSGGPRD